ncbi:hypothetical protein GF324_07160 [bacterium]|nr:hypothetical protein [bacterium]
MLACRLCVWLLLIVSFLLPFQADARTADVVLTGDINPALRKEMENHLRIVLQKLGVEEPAAFRSCFPSSGFEEFSTLTGKLKLMNGRSVQESPALRLPDGEYEVRDIKVQVSRAGMGDTRGSPYQYLVFTFNSDGLITGTRFAMEQHIYKRLIEEGDKLDDFAFHQQILQFVELFRTAYNRKDIEYIEKVFSDDALIIVGRVVKEKPDAPDQRAMFESSSLGKERIELVRKSREDYITSLRGVFRNNSFLKVQFDSLEVLRHHNDKRLYGVTLKQHWNSSSYSDTGFVFLMIDFKDEDNPLIHVRSWQPEKFSDGSVISLYDFQLIR